MPTYTTPRSGTVSAIFHDLTSGVWNATVYNGVDPDPTAFAVGEVIHYFPWGSPDIGGYVRFYAQAAIPATVPPTIPPIGIAPITWVAKTFVDVQIVPGGAVVTYSGVESSATVAPNAYHTFNITWAGDVSYEVVLDETFTNDYLDPTEAVYMPAPSDPSALPFVDTGGNAQADGIPARKAAVQAYPTLDQTIVVSVSNNSASGSVSMVWDGSLGFYFGNQHALIVRAAGASGLATAFPKVRGVSLYGQVSPSHSASSGGYSFSASPTGLSVSGGVSLGGSTLGAEMDAGAEIASTYRIKPKFVAADGSSWPTALTVNASSPSTSQAITGTGSFDVVQRSWEVLDYVDGSLIDSDGVDDGKGYVSAAVGQSSLTAAHLDKRDWRLEFLTYRTTGITPAHASSQTVSGTWSGGASGGIGYVLSSGAGSFALSGSNKLLGGYRFLEVQLKPVGFGDRDVTVTLTNQDISKTYTVRLGADGTTAYYRIDTASPSNVPANGTPTQRDTRYPLRPQPSHADSPVVSEPDDDTGYLEPAVTPGDDPTDADVLERARTWIWGANDADTVTVSVTLSAGETLQIGGVRLVRVGSPTITLAEGFCAQGKILQDGIDCMKLWPLTAAGGRTTEVGAVWGAPFLYTFIDGRLVYDLPSCGYRQFVVGGYEWAYDTAATVAGNLGHLPGWSCTDSASSNFYGLGTSSQFSGSLLGGGGIGYDGSWVVWIDHALGAIPIQDRYDWVYAWPTAGDCFGFGSEETDKAVVLPCGKILGNRSQGMAFQDDASATPGAPLASATVKDYRSDLGTDVEYGTSNTGADGSFVTGVIGGPIGTVTVPTDYLAGGEQHVKTKLLSGSNPEDGGYARARWILRTGFRGVSAAAQNPHLAVSPQGSVYLAYGLNGTVRAMHARGPYAPWEHDSLIDAGPGDFRPRLAYDHQTGDLLCAYERTGTCRLRISKDGGKTWGTETNMGTGYRPELGSSHTGGLIHLRLEDIGGGAYNLYVKHRTDAAGLVWSSETLVTDETSAAISVSLEGWGGIVAPWNLAGGWLLSIVPFGETTPVRFLSRERKALSFKRVT